MKLFRILSILLIVLSLLLVCACGKENQDDNQKGEENTPNTVKREPQGKTSAEKLCWLLEDMGYVRSDVSGEEYFANWIAQMSQGGAIIPQETYEQFLAGLEEIYVYERGIREACFVDLGKEGLKTYAEFFYNKPIENYEMPEFKKLLNERENVYDNCLILNKDELVYKMVDRYLKNEPPVQTIYEGEEGSQGLEYELSKDGTFYILTGIGTCTDRDVVIPNMYKGKPVRIIDDFVFRNNKQIVSVKTGGNVEIIYASFENCPNLISVTLGKGVAVVPNYAFTMCVNLVEVYNFSSLEIKEPDDTQDDWIMFTAVALDIYNENVPSKLDIVDNFVFYVNNDSVKLVAYIGYDTQIRLPENYNGEKYTVATGAFSVSSIYEGTTVKSLIIPQSVDTIEKFAFEGELTVYCEAQSRPLGWHEYWARHCTVEWGYQE